MIGGAAHQRKPIASRRWERDRDALSLRAAMGPSRLRPRRRTTIAHSLERPDLPRRTGRFSRGALGQTRPASSSLACGSAPYLRELARRGLSCTGGDVVFAKLVVGPPLGGRAGGRADLLRCWLALADRRASAWPRPVQRCLPTFWNRSGSSPNGFVRRLPDDGLLAVSHVHNSGATNMSSGAAVTAEALAELFPGAILYDDSELTRALAEARRASASARVGIPRRGRGIFPLFSVMRCRRAPFSAVWRYRRPARRYAGTRSTASTTASPGHRRAIATSTPRPRPTLRSLGCATAAMLSRQTKRRALRELVDLPERW